MSNRQERELDDDLDIVYRVRGLFVGQLSPSEMRAFDRLCLAGRAMRSYGGVAGLMGLPKVVLLEDEEDAAR